MKKLRIPHFNASYYFILSLFTLTVLLSSCENKIKKDSTVIYLVRHAEKDLTNTTSNPPLTAEGEARAEKLVEELKKVPLSRIFSTKYDRNINTVKPLATEQDIDIEEYAAHDWHPMLDEIKTIKGNAFLICGHGDNLLPMIDYLGADRPINEMGHLEYDKLFKVTLMEDTNVIEMTVY